MHLEIKVILNEWLRDNQRDTNNFYYLLDCFVETYHTLWENLIRYSRMFAYSLLSTFFIFFSLLINSNFYGYIFREKNNLMEHSFNKFISASNNKRLFQWKKKVHFDDYDNIFSLPNVQWNFPLIIAHLSSCMFSYRHNFPKYIRCRNGSTIEIIISIAFTSWNFDAKRGGKFPVVWTWLLILRCYCCSFFEKLQFMRLK